MMPLVFTKLQTPSRRGRKVQRDRLTDLLEGFYQHKLLAVIAPAGYGKTTLISEWLLQSQHRYAWLSLDKNDNNHRTFISYLLAAFQTIDPEVCKTAQAMVRDDQPLEFIIAGLLNDLTALDEDWIVVLDDYHLIASKTIHDSISFLLSNLPPNIHLIITSRHQLPFSIASMRARGEALELDSHDLRFTQPETVSFFSDVMGLKLCEDQIGALEEQAEGWIAGLQLIALSLRTCDDVNRFIQTFSNEVQLQYITEYLLEEVLKRTSTDLRTFLLETSVLSRMSAPLCDRVTGRDDAAVMLDYLESAGMFTFSIDNKKQWFAYHHLFAHLLQEQLAREAGDHVNELHRRAARWYDEHDSPSEAIQHAIEGQDYAFAVAAIERVAQGMILSKETSVLRSWVEVLPRATIEGNPRLLLADAWFDATLEGLLDKAFDTAQAVKQTATPDLMAECLALLAFISKTRGDIDEAISFSNEALRYFKPNENKKLYGFIINNLGEAYRLAGDFDAWDADLDSSLKLDLTDVTMRCYILFSSAVLLMARGKPDESGRICEKGINLSIHADKPNPVSSALYMHLSRVECERNHLETAEALADRGLEIAEKWHYFYSLYWTNLSRCLIKQARGEHAEALESINRSMYYSLREGSDWLYNEAVAFKVWIQILQGEVADAVRWQHKSGLTINSVYGYHHTQRYTFLAFARLLIAQKRWEDAAIVLGQLELHARQHQRTNYLLEIMVLQALTLTYQGSVRQALNVIGEALTTGHTWGYFRIFINNGAPMMPVLQMAYEQGIEKGFVEKLIEALQREGGSLNTVLTDREIEIIRLMGKHLTSNEIAQDLVLSPHTVRTHIKNIYEKIDVHCRSEALERARELKLL